MYRAIGLASAMAVILVLTGCNTTAAQHHGSRTTHVPTLTATVAPTMPPTPIPPPCSPAAFHASPGVAVQTGDLLLSPTFTAPGDGPDAFLFQVPDGTPHAPLRLPAPGADGFYHGRPSGWPATTIGTSNNIYVALCNSATSTTHVLQSVRITVTDVTPYSGQLNVWNYCEGYYARPAGIKPNSCDRGPVWGEASHQTFQVTLPSPAPAGTTVPATETSPSTGGGALGPLPITLAGGRALYIEIGVALPATPGTYLLAVNLTVDGAALPAATGASLLFAPISQTWSAQACTTTTMQAMIPAATTPPSPYVCPNA